MFLCMCVFSGRHTCLPLFGLIVGMDRMYHVQYLYLFVYERDAYAVVRDDRFSRRLWRSRREAYGCG